MTTPSRSRLVHLELHTGNAAAACDFYARLVGWMVERVDTGVGHYLTLGLDGGIEGGIVEHDGDRPFWLPYIEVADLVASTERARRLGAAIVLAPREGPAGWRSRIATAAAGEIALWQPKR